MVRPALLCLSLLLPSFTVVDAQQLTFARESIAIDVQTEMYTLSGLYTFENPGPAPVHALLFYPFAGPIDAIDSLVVRDETDSADVPYEKGPTGISFAVDVPPLNTSVYRVAFRCKAPDRRCEYILTSTAFWRRPLDHTEITVSVPDTLRAVSWSYRPDGSEQGIHRRIYRLDRSHFSPDRNFILRWERSSP